MGLDMYLNRTTYVGGEWEHRGMGGKIEITKDGKPYLVMEGSRIHEVVERVITWRKANQIHNWFVHEIQEDNDDCRIYYVSIEDLKRLHDVIVDVLDTRDPEELPPREGFFFGSDQIDEQYWEELEYTLKELKRVIAEDPNILEVGYTYQSSW